MWAGVIAAVLAMTAPAGAQAPTEKPAPKIGATGQGTATKKTPSTAARAYDRALLRPALLKDKAPEQYKVKFVTTRGEFTLAVTRAWAPLGADRFYNLVKSGFFDDARFFRVIEGFMVQFGLNGDPAVTKAWMNSQFKDDPVKQSNKRGYATFAKSSAPNSRSTQVFINFGDNANLDAQGFAPFGEVTTGMGVADKLYSGYAGRAQDNFTNIMQQGNAYLAKDFPKLDYIKTATIGK